MITDEESAAAILHVLTVVLDQDVDSHLTSALERYGIEEMDDLITMRPRDINQLKSSQRTAAQEDLVHDAPAPTLIQGILMNKVRSFIAFVGYRASNKNNSIPIGDDWIDITREEFNDFAMDPTLLYQFGYADYDYDDYDNEYASNTQTPIQQNRAFVKPQTKGSDKVVSYTPTTLKQTVVIAAPSIDCQGFSAIGNDDEFVNTTQILQSNTNDDPDVDAKKVSENEGNAGGYHERLATNLVEDSLEDNEVKIIFISQTETPAFFDKTAGPLSGSQVASDAVFGTTDTDNIGAVFGTTDTENIGAVWKDPARDALHHFFANCLVDNKPMRETTNPIIGLLCFVENARPPGSTSMSS
jgi:hypothetical protein